MTYKYLIDRITEVCSSHNMVELVGYGQVSDISYPETEQAPDYPYVFINPVDVGLDRGVFTATINLICMTQSLDDSSPLVDSVDKDAQILGSQSKCMQILNDVLAYFSLTTNDKEISYNTPVSMTPFVERFQDDVVGATALVTFRYGKSMSACESPIFGVQKSLTAGTPATVIDGDETVHLVQGGETYTCLPATAKSGIVYQRIIPWEQNDPSIDGSIAYHVAQGVYDYEPPKNPVSTALLQNGYVGSDAGSLLMYDNAFGNKYRFTNDVGEQFVEAFAESAANTSTNPRYCIDHLTGLGWYIQDAFDYNQITIPEAMAYSLTFSYGGYSDWRLADISEYLNSVNYNDWNNAYMLVYAPFVDNFIRNYGGELATGTYTKDNQYVYVRTNGSTVTLTNALFSPRHQLLIRNHYI